MQLSKYGKSFSIQKKISSRSNYRDQKLPYIHKTIDFTNKSHVNFYSQHFIDKFTWVLQQKNYQQMNNKEIQKEYELLRKQIFALNDIVAKFIGKFQRKLERKRLNTQTDPQKINQLTEKQIENNLNILQRMKKQYHGLKNKTSTLLPKENIQKQIEDIKSQISILKQKNISLKLKNKNIGDSIINTDQVLNELRQTERQWEQWMKKKKQLETKLQKVNSEYDKVFNSLNQIQLTSSKAQNFMRFRQQNKKAEQQRIKTEQLYKQKAYSVQVFKKNLQSMTSMKQQRYHQLLKQLENHLKKEQQIKSKDSEIQYNLVNFAKEVRFLQSKLKDVKNENSKLELDYNQNQSSEDLLSADTAKSIKIIKKNPNLVLSNKFKPSELSVESKTNFSRSSPSPQIKEQKNEKKQIQLFESKQKTSSLDSNTKTSQKHPGIIVDTHKNASDKIDILKSFEQIQTNRNIKKVAQEQKNQDKPITNIKIFNRSKKEDFKVLSKNESIHSNQMKNNFQIRTEFQKSQKIQKNNQPSLADVPSSQLFSSIKKSQKYKTDLTSNQHQNKTSYIQDNKVLNIKNEQKSFLKSGQNSIKQPDDQNTNEILQSQKQLHVQTKRSNMLSIDLVAIQKDIKKVEAQTSEAKEQLLSKRIDKNKLGQVKDLQFSFDI